MTFSGNVSFALEFLGLAKSTLTGTARPYGPYAYSVRKTLGGAP
jgi:hypothetical protein